MTKSLVLRGRVGLLLSAAVLVAASLLPALTLTQSAEAAQLPNRSVTIDKSGTTETDVEYRFEFDIPSVTAVQGIRILFCTTPLGTCTPVTGFDASARVYDSISGWDQATAFAVRTTNLGDCTVATATNDEFEVCLERTEAGNEDNLNNVLTISGIAHTAIAAETTIYARAVLYSDTSFATDVHDGVVATSIVDTLTINARVQENLMFCIGTTAVDDGATSVGADCSTIGGTTVDIGVVDTTTGGAISPDTDGNSLNGVAFLRTNANGGTLIGYRSVQQSGTNHLGTLRVPGASCNAGVISTDQCFNTNTAETALANSTEHWGMTARYVNTASGGTTTAVTRDADFDFSTSGYAWDETGAYDEVAVASGAVDDEALILKFGATAAITTPTGSYTAQAKFVATPTF